MIRTELLGQRMEPEAAGETRSDARGKALIVDSDEMFLAFAAEVLNSFSPGFEVTTAPNANAALQWLRTTDPNLLLVGLDPDDEEVVALVEAFRELPGGDRRRIVYLARQVSSSRQAARPPGDRCHAVLPKPTRLTELLGLVQHSMNG